jgi:hypothetical protein
MKNKISMNDILVEKSTYNRNNLRKRLILEKIFEHKCYTCNNVTWQNAPIPLELEHINGIRDDNRIENLTLLCPNCHAQTNTYCGKNIKTTKHKKISDETLINIIPKCKNITEVFKTTKISKAMENYNRIRSIMKIHNLEFIKYDFSDKEIENFLSRRKVNRPTKEELTKLVWELPSSKLSDRFGVSDKSISKWCEFYGISKPPRGYWSKIKNEIS